MADPVLPTATSLVVPAIQTIASQRPESLKYFNGNVGRWADLPAIWRGQILTNLTRLADEVNACRLKSAKGDVLRQLCASEFNTVLPSEPQVAYATVTLTRPAPLVNGIATATAAPAGIIREGTLFNKQANPAAQPLPIAAAQYKVAHTVYVGAGFGVPGTLHPTVTVQLVASSPGVAANVPVFVQPPVGGIFVNPSPGLLVNVPNTSITPSQPLFDATFTTSFASASGGSSGLSDPVLVAASKAYAIGQFGPTDGALVAGVLQQQSVRHYAFFKAGALPYAQAFVADESWGSTPQWYGQIAQSMASVPWLGFGARIRFGQVVNQQVAIAPVIVLQSTDDLNFTDDIDASVRAAAESYFNDRANWYTWKLSELQAILSIADSRILQCSAVTVTDVASGSPLAETLNTAGQTWSATLVHPFLTDRNCTATYLPPA